MKAQFKKVKRWAEAIIGLSLVWNRGSNYEIQADDVFLASYPRSGNTYLRWLLSSYLYSESVDFVNMRLFIPDVLTYYGVKKAYHSNSKPKILKTHLPFNVRMNKVIYVVRDPRDVAYSWYKYKNPNNENTLDHFMDHFINKSTLYGTWQENVMSYCGRGLENDKVLFVKYEDLVLHPKDVLIKICQFLNSPIDDDKMDKAIEKCSKRKMAKEYRENQGAAKMINFFENGITEEHRNLIETEFSLGMNIFNYN